MQLKQLLSVLLLTFLLTGCYHASITTGLEASNEVIDKPWAMSFVYGLIPPAEIDASAECSNGVAKVETQLSFLNQVVSALTAGIITPMHITITCASDGKTALIEEIEKEQVITIPSEVSKSELQEIYKYASDLAVTMEKPIYIQH